MTDKEADALDEELTRKAPAADPAKARRAVRMIAVDDLSAKYLTIKAAATNQTPEAVLSGIIRTQIAAGA
ncbi:MAG: hypothetical protein LBS82_01475 [Spirochaetaceae bacterium]|jgi:hypothetical protein|nr:hypothetical protein [Spirochaetaceae bacterium]